MRKANERVLNTDIYARLNSVQMSVADRRNAEAALLKAEQVADAILWLRDKIADAGQAFLKPSLRT